MSKNEHPLWLAKRIGRRNAAAMTSELRRLLHDGTDMLTLIDGARIMKWPDDAHEAAQVRYDELAMEILIRTFRDAGPAIEAAFLAAARDVLEAERQRQAESGDVQK
ncbi:MAG TPA: hypothetical protein VEU30_06130 [Thermoanaerobaculia bacterium]|nr:hypothetical protein [Thermoanaerobaculia bacterium]